MASLFSWDKDFMKNNIIFIVILLVSSPAVSVDRCASWGCISTVSDLYTNADGLIYVGTPLDETLANCSAVLDVYFSINPESGNAEKMYSSILAAYVSGKKIQLRVKENNSKCELSYVRLSADF
ncbi:hypothetical protein [Bacterioplanoides sp.]|uniref:hypothetical protein n=1 Tax=Bacterioplanoides sp. TaxID=2066072 RepID=UPI003BA9B956